MSTSAVRRTTTAATIPAVIHHRIVLSALRDDTATNAWLLICEDPASTPDLEPSYVVWHAWLAADGHFYAETGHYDLTWEHAQRVLLDRAGYRHQHAVEMTITRRSSTVATTTVSGHPVALVARCDGTKYLRIDLIDAITGELCGTADCLDDNVLQIDLPTVWSITDRSRVACLITQIAFFPRNAQ